MPGIIAFLKSLGWKRDVNYGGQVSWISPDSDRAVGISGSWWELRHFVERDRDGVAGMHAVSDEEGETLAELKLALAEVGVL